jgi:SAM-dependent methyltransferase
MYIAIAVLLIIVCVFCFINTTQSGRPIGKYMIALVLVFLLTSSKCDTINTKISGGDTHNGIVNNGDAEDVAEKYSKLHTMINRQLKYTGTKYKHNDSFFSKMYQIYKYKPSNTKKWGNVSRPQLEEKFNDNIMKVLNAVDGKGSVLDYGCGDGWALKYFEDRNVKNTICVDIDDYRTYTKNSVFLKNSHLSSMDSVGNNSLDLVMALQSLHHIEFDGEKTKYMDRVHLIIKSIVSKLKSGGHLLIREHDVKNISDVYPVLFEHLLYDLMELTDKSMSLDELKKWVNNYHIHHKGWYFSKDFLHNILRDHNMKLVETEYKKGLNSSHIYNSLYMVNNTMR